MAGINRRNLLIFGGAAAYVSAWQLWPRAGAALTFEPIAGAPGWRIAAGGSVSGGADMMTIGLNDGPAPLAAQILPEVVHHSAEGPGYRIAVFTDFFCPNCRKMDLRLRALEKDNLQEVIMLTWHELPLLGRASKIAAQALAAANLQFQRDAYYDTLRTNGFKPSPQWLVRVAEEAGLDVDQFRKDIDGEMVEAFLDASAAAAVRLGIGATPATVGGRSVAMGVLTDAQITQLLSQDW